MRTDNLQEFKKLHRDLFQERRSLQTRLQQINEALGEIDGQQAPGAITSSTPAPPARRGRRSSGKSLKSHVIEVLQNGLKTKEEILDEVQRRGYKFNTKNPANSLGVILYGKNPKFHRVDGRFSLGTNPQSAGPAGKSKRAGKRTMSPEARERIAAAQRKRWAKQKR